MNVASKYTVQLHAACASRPKAVRFPPGRSSDSVDAAAAQPSAISQQPASQLQPASHALPPADGRAQAALSTLASVIVDSRSAPASGCDFSRGRCGPFDAYPLCVRTLEGF